MTPVDIATMVTTDISDPDEAATWVAVILAESGGNPVAVNLVDEDPTSRAYLSTDNGLLQINSFWHGANIPVHEANRPELAWAYARKIAGTPSNWAPWNVYRSGAYKAHLATAQAAVLEVLGPNEPKGEPVTDTITYGPRVNVHADRIGADRSGQSPLVKYLVLHTSEQSGAEDPQDAEDLAKYLQSPGDRPGSNGNYGSSYHGITDTDRVLPCVRDTFVAYAAGGGNKDGLHLCLPVKAGQTREQWLDATSRPYIMQAALWIVDKSKRYGIPIRRISIEQLKGGSWGYCDHNTVSKAFGKSTHTDCGPTFPWDVLESDIARLTADESAEAKPDPIKPPTTTPDPEEPDMAPRFFKTPASKTATWVTTDNVTAVRVTGPQLVAIGIPKVETITATEAAKFAYVGSLDHDVIGLTIS